MSDRPWFEGADKNRDRTRVLRQKIVEGIEDGPVEVVYETPEETTRYRIAEDAEPIDDGRLVHVKTDADQWQTTLDPKYVTEIRQC